METQCDIPTLFARVLEEYAFMFAEAAPQSPDAPEDASLVTVRYSGENEGAVCLAAERAFYHVLYDNMVGAADAAVHLEPAHYDLQAADAFKEVCNVVAGQVVTARFGTQKKYRLSVPELRVTTREEWQSLLATGGASVMLVDQQFPVLVASTN